MTFITGETKRYERDNQNQTEHTMAKMQKKKEKKTNNRLQNTTKKIKD